MWIILVTGAIKHLLLLTFSPALFILHGYAGLKFAHVGVPSTWFTYVESAEILASVRRKLLQEENVTPFLKLYQEKLMC